MAKHSNSGNELRDAILKRMLETPHKPHVPVKKKRKQSAGKGRVRVGKSRS
jgi:mRNA-degrading endonuclease RelE of RelBE toxin-antitoxin system